MSATYESAGVSIEAGEKAVKAISEAVKSTSRPEVWSDIGGFGGLFALDGPAAGDDSPVLVSATDGVGTKAMVATMAKKYDSIGIDLVAMCVDDLVCQGAEPLFFLDYISVGTLDPEHVTQLVEGVARGCRMAGCALIGGEMAEHPGAMEPGEFDLVGFGVGSVKRKNIIDGSTVEPGDVLIGIPSPGIRSNGYSLVRKVFFEIADLSLDGPAWDGSETTLGEELLLPSVIYAPAILELANNVAVKSVAHITGGGIAGNLNRVISPVTDALVDTSTWEPPRIFSEIQRLGNISDAEMSKVFNMGIGMIVVVAPEQSADTIAVLSAAGHTGIKIGEIVSGSGRVTLG